MKESEEKPLINLYFFHINNIYVTGLKFCFQRDIECIKNNICTIVIPEEFFKYGKGKRAVSYKVYGGEEKKYLGERNMFLYYGENNAYFQLDFFGKTFEYIFKGKNLNFEVKDGSIKFDKFDTFGTKDRKRLVLLNYLEDYIKINGTPFYSTIVYNNLKISNILSFQISEINYINETYIIKEIIDFPKINFKDLTEEKDVLNNFFEGIKNLLEIKDKDLYKNQYNEVRAQFTNSLNMRQIMKFLTLNGPKHYIMEMMDKETCLDLEIYWRLNLYVYFMKKKKLSKNNIFFQKLYEKSLNMKIKLDNDQNLNLFQKIYILNNFFDLVKSCKNIKSLNSINIRYFLFSKSKPNSILSKVKKFFNEFIYSLTEDSYIFPYILKVDAGCGYYKSDKIFTYDIQNLNMIKFHLNQIFPDILFFYYKKNDTMASTSCQGSISINEYKLLKHDKQKYISKINYEDEQIDKDLSDNIAMDIVLDFFHEYTGHKKFSEYEYYNDSPKKYFDNSGNLIELMPIIEGSNKHEEDNKEYILSSSDNNEGESGYFIELSFGKIGSKYVFDEMYKLKNKSDLLCRVDLFTNASADKLKEYVSLKRIVEKEKFGIDLKNSTIEEQILKMKKDEKVCLKFKENEDKGLIGRKKKRELKTIKFNDSDEKSKKFKKKKIKNNSNAEQKQNCSILIESDEKSDSEEKSKSDCSEDEESKEEEENERKEYERIKKNFLNKYNIDLSKVSKYNLLYDDYEKIMSKEDILDFYSIYDRLIKRCNFKIK